MFRAKMAVQCKTQQTAGGNCHGFTNWHVTMWLVAGICRTKSQSPRFSLGLRWGWGGGLQMTGA